MVFAEFIMQLAFAFNILAILFISIGGIVSVIEIVKHVASRGRKSVLYNHARIQFTKNTIFGLEFLIAGDILRTIIFPNLDDIIRLAIVVSIRTVLAFFLTKEIKLKI